MRHVNFVYIEKVTLSDYQKEIKKWKDANFEYVPFHYLLDLSKLDEVSIDMSLNELVTRGRPLSMNNGLIRDAFISPKGVGILVLFDAPDLSNKMYEKLGELVKFIVMDLGLNSYQLVTSFYEENKKIDVLKLNGYIKNAKDYFLKLQK